MEGYNSGMETHFFDVLIVGAGPAGLSAGIYACRGGLKTAIIEGSAAGGLASTAARVENYPGVDPVDGFTLCYNMLTRCKEEGAQFFFDRAVSFDLAGETKKIVLASGETLSAKAAILCVGSTVKKLGVEGESKFAGRGISYCATCDGAMYKGKVVAVVGGGNTALQDALYLEKLAKSVYLIHRRDAFRADDVYQKRLEKSGVHPILNSVVAALVGEDKLSQIEVKDVKTGSLTSLLVDCVFVAVGQEPNTKCFEGIARDERGYIVTDDEMRTSVAGVYAAGDVRKKSLRQIVTAVADGAIAATAAVADLT